MPGEDGAPVVTTGETTSVSTTVPTIDPGVAPLDNAAFLEQLPEAHREKPWAKEYKDMEGFIKSFEDKSASLSKRPAGIPDANASDEDKVAFNKARGVPAVAGDYALEAHPEGYEPTEADTKFRSGVQQMFHKANLDPGQAKSVETDFNAMMAEINEANAAAKGASDAEFDALVARKYGTEADAVLASNKALIEKHTDPEFLSHIGTLDNKTLMALSTAVDGIRKAYIGEDKLPDGDVPIPTGAKTNDEIQAEMAKVMGSEAFGNPSHPGHTKAVEDKNLLVSQLKFK